MADAVALMDYVKPDVLGLDSSRSDQGGCYVDCLSDHICTTPSDEICGGNDEIPYQRFVATSANPVTLVAGNTYTNPNYYDGNGAAGEVQQGGILTAQEITFAGNTASGGGGAVFIDGGTAIFDDVIFSGNVASLAGGTIASGGALHNDGMISLQDASFQGNHVSVSSVSSHPWVPSTSYGGAIFNSGTVTILKIIFLENSVSAGTWYATSISCGGAVFNSGTMSLTDTSFINNNAIASSTYYEESNSNSRGGAIFNSGSIFLKGVNFSGNTASASTFSYPCNAEGGAIYNIGTMTLSDSSFTDNRVYSSAPHDSYSYGGAIANSGTLTMVNVLFMGNRTTADYTSKPSCAYGGEFTTTEALSRWTM